jgi:Rha family phage regulatory protein
MNEDVKTIMRGMTRREGDPRVSSRTLAELFEKDHKRVLQDIRRMMQDVDQSEIPSDISGHGSVPSSYLDANGKPQPECHLTRDAAMFLVFGWTGRNAVRWKLQLIAAFRAMEEEIVRLKSQGVSPWAVRCLRAEPCDWSLMFDTTIVEAVSRVFEWKMDGRRVPRQMASIFQKLYRIILGAEVYRELKKRNPNPRHGSNHHQHLDDTIRDELKRASGFIVYAAHKAGKNPAIFWSEVQQFYGHRQVELFKREIRQ